MAQPKTSPKRPVSRPKIPLPKDAWDCHSHVFGPFDRFPVYEDRRYDPPYAPAEHYLEMLDACGFARGVSVHASVNTYDNSVTEDAINRQPGRVIGTSVVARGTKDAELQRMHERGFRAVRFTINNPPPVPPGALDFDDLKKIAPELKAIGWHALIWSRLDWIMERSKELVGHGIPLIFDHMGYFEAKRGVSDATFQNYLAWLKDNPSFFVKLTVVRLSTNDPLYPELRPFHEALLTAAPGQVVFGSDWPFIGMDDNMPDVGHLVDLFDSWTPDAALRQKILVDNPRKFFDGK